VRQETGTYIEILGTDFLVHKALEERKTDSFDPILKGLDASNVKKVTDGDLSFVVFNMSGDDAVRFLLCPYDSGFLLMYRGDQRMDKLKKIDDNINSLAPKYITETPFSELSGFSVQNIEICPLREVDSRSVYFQSNPFKYVRENRESLMGLFEEYC